tara:strand:- start:31 stop:366 length:336 start_codon:yes stop_codon:yes gene_type:complete
MSLFDDVKDFAKMDLAARKVLNGNSFTKLDDEVELGVGEGLQTFDPSEDATSVPFEAEHEDWALHAQADDILAAGSVPCWESGYTLKEAAEMAAEREAANDGWEESRYLIA